MTNRVTLWKIKRMKFQKGDRVRTSDGARGTVQCNAVVCSADLQQLVSVAYFVNGRYWWEYQLTKTRSKYA